MQRRGTLCQSCRASMPLRMNLRLCGCYGIVCPMWLGTHGSWVLPWDGLKVNVRISRLLTKKVGIPGRGWGLRWCGVNISKHGPKKIHWGKSIGFSFWGRDQPVGLLTFTGGWQRRNRLETDEEIKANQAGQLKICWGALDGADQECHPSCGDGAGWWLLGCRGWNWTWDISAPHFGVLWKNCGTTLSGVSMDMMLTHWCKNKVGTVCWYSMTKNS